MQNTDTADSTKKNKKDSPANTNSFQKASTADTTDETQQRRVPLMDSQT